MSLQDDMMETAFLAQLAVREEAATYHPNGSYDFAVTGLLRANPADLVEGSPGGSTDVRTGTFRVTKTEVASPTRNDKVTIRSTKWSVITFDDLGYAWQLNLQRSVVAERGAAPFRNPRL